jgi:hypothetical protein
MKTTSRFPLTHLTLVFLFSLLLAPTNVVAQATDTDDTTVYWAGKKRVHVKDCRRMPSDPAEITAMTKMTLTEAEEKGLALCSRCPGSDTPGKATPKEDNEADNEDEEAGKDAEPSVIQEGEVTVYQAAGKKRAHVADCPRYKRLSEEEKKAMTPMTLKEAEEKGLPLCSRCPGSTQE